MGTYFGYVKKEADSYINWADIGKQMVDGLDKIEKDREGKRKAFEQDTRDKYNFVADNPMGQSQSVNEFSLNLANNAQQYLLEMNKLVKSGKMKMNDYLTRSQNLKDDTQTMYKIMKTYQERAKVVSERMQKNQSQPIEWQTFEQMEGFGNFAKTYAHIDANSGRLWSAEKEKKIVDGKEIYTIPSTPSGKLQPMQMLAATMNMNYDRYDLNGSLSKIVAGFGKHISVIEDIKAKVGKHGRISEVLDIRNRKGLMPGVKSDIEGFEQAETKMIESQLTNQFNTTSILMSDMRPQGGGQYGITYDLEEAKRDPSKIYMKVVNNKLQPDFESTVMSFSFDSFCAIILAPSYQSVDISLYFSG